MTQEEIASLKPGDVIRYVFSANVEPYHYVVVHVNNYAVRACVPNDDEWHTDFEHAHLAYDSFQLCDQDPL